MSVMFVEHSLITPTPFVVGIYRENKMQISFRLEMWLMGWGVSHDSIKAILESDRVKWELAQEPPDGVGTMQAVQSTMYSHFEDCREAITELEKPLERILFLNMFD